MTFCSGGPRPSDKGGGEVPGHPDPEIRGGPGLKFFLVWSKNMGGASPPGPSSGSATVLVTGPDSPPLSYRRLVWVNVACVFN